MSDIFREIDEEVRRERLRKVWDQYSNVIIAMALLIIIGIGGWRLYQWWETKQAAEAGRQFETAPADIARWRGSAPRRNSPRAIRRRR